MGSAGLSPRRRPVRSAVRMGQRVAGTWRPTRMDSLNAVNLVGWLEADLSGISGAGDAGDPLHGVP